MKVLSDASLCEYEDCKQMATRVVYSRSKQSVVFCCDDHGDSVVDEGHPEHIDDCPNCGCRMGVN